MSVLIKPIITEKMTAESELNNRYGFVVSSGANKIEIKNAIESTYGVTVERVRTMNSVSYTHLRAHETDSYLVCRLLLEKNFFNDTATTEIYTSLFVGSVRCV